MTGKDTSPPRDSTIPSTDPATSRSTMPGRIMCIAKVCMS